MEIAYLNTPQDVVQTALMESKRKWNFSAFDSLADAFDALAEEGLRGDKGFYGSVALAIFLSLGEVEREDAANRLRLAMRRSKTEGGTVLEHWRKLDATPPAEEPTLPQSHQASLEAEIRKQANQIVDDAEKKEADQKKRKRAS